MTDSQNVTTTSVPIPPRKGVHAIRPVLKRYPLAQLGVLVILGVALFITVPAMGSIRSMTALLVITALLAVASLGQTLVVILGGLDLAIVGYITFGAYVAVNLAGQQEVPLPWAFLLTIGVTGVIGALTGFLCFKFNIQPLVMTLGVGAMVTGATLFLSNSEFTSAPPDALRALTSIKGTTFGIPVPPILIVVIVAIGALWFFLSRTVTGRRIYATGVNPRAAQLSRVNTTAIWTGVFAFSGVTAGIAGMLIAGFGSGWSSGIGDPYLFTGLAAVLVGGSTFGSINGSYTRTILGALILTVLSTLLISNGFNDAQSKIVYGLIVLLVVALFGRDRHVRDRF